MELDRVILVPKEGSLGRERLDDAWVETFQGRSSEPDSVPGVHGLRVRWIGYERKSPILQVLQHLGTRDLDERSAMFSRTAGMAERPEAPAPRKSRMRKVSA